MRKTKGNVRYGVVAALAVSGVLTLGGLARTARADGQDAEAIARALEERLGDALKYEGSSAKSTSKKPQHYWLRCRGAEKVVIYHSPKGKSLLMVVFRRGSGPAGENGENLKAGECSWLDRKVNADEPNTIVITGASFWAELSRQGEETGYRTGGRTTKAWRALEDLLDTGSCSDYRVRKAGSQFLTD